MLFRLPGLPAVVQGAYRAASDFCEVRNLPWSHETPAVPFAPAAAFDRVIDLRDFAFDPAFRGVAMIDYFLARLGLVPAAVAPGARRNSWLQGRLVPPPPPGLAPGYVLVCPRAAQPMRCMPDAIHAAILAWLAARPGLHVVTQGPAGDGAIAAPSAADFTGLCGLVAGAALLVSVDTGMVHLADALSVPCLAIFTTHRPEWRVRDYPLCRAIHLPAALPEALEFARSAEDEHAATAAWAGFNRFRAVLEEMLDAVLRAPR